MTPIQSVSAITPWIFALELRVEDRRLLVQRAPPLDREVHDRHVDERDERGDRVALRRRRSGRPGCAAARGSRGRGRRGPRCVTRRASHAHQTPQTGLPQSEPSTSVSAVNSTPSSADAPASRSQTSERVRGQRKSADATRGDDEREVREPRRRDVEVHEPLRFPLRRVLGRAPEPEQREHDQRDERRPAEDAREPRVEQPVPGLVASLMSPPTAVRTPARRSPCRAPRRSRAARPTATRLRGAPSSPSSKARVAPSITGASTGSRSSGSSVSRSRSPAASTP